MNKIDTIKIEIGKNKTVPIEIIDDNEKNIVIVNSDPLRISLKDCIVQPIKDSSDYTHYDGSYSITPSNDRQVLPTNDKVMLDNLVVEPIPQNYGLISWNGSTLTIS